MTTSPHRRWISATALGVAAACAVTTAAEAQGRPEGPQGPMQHAAQLDREGHTDQARAIYQTVIDSASDPATIARTQRAMALSYAFDGDCDQVLKYERMVIDYWKSREQAEPQNAFYQEGEMADEGARICLDAGELDAAEEWYRLGHELGLKEPEPRTHPKSLWDYRLAHASARIAARRGNEEEAQRQIAMARQALEHDPDMAEQQQRFFPYLVGYVALYTGDLAKAETELSHAIAMRGNDRDPFMHCLLALTYERMGRQEEARAMYQKAYDMARAHNPPAAYARRVAREKLGLPASR